MAEEINNQENTQEKSAPNPNETKAEKFVRIGGPRVKKAIEAIINLENLSNRSSYEYTQEQVDNMFEAIENTLAEVKVKFQPKSKEKESRSDFHF